MLFFTTFKCQLIISIIKFLAKYLSKTLVSFRSSACLKCWPRIFLSFKKLKKMQIFIHFFHTKLFKQDVNLTCICSVYGLRVVRHSISKVFFVSFRHDICITKYLQSAIHALFISYGTIFSCIKLE